MGGVWLFALVLLALPGPLRGQDVAQIAPGERIRITIAPDPVALEKARDALGAGSPGAVVEGNLIDMDEGVTARWVGVLRQEPSTMLFEALSRLEVQRSRSLGDGAARGALWGALGGAVIIGGAALSENDFTTSGKALFALVGAGLGAGIGALVGAATSGHRWEEIPIGVAQRSRQKTRLFLECGLHGSNRYQPTHPRRLYAPPYVSSSRIANGHIDRVRTGIQRSR